MLSKVNYSCWQSLVCARSSRSQHLCAGLKTLPSAGLDAVILKTSHHVLQWPQVTMPDLMAEGALSARTRAAGAPESGVWG